MRSKEECSWCKSTSDIERTISKHMPEEYKYRCSACHELFWEEHTTCDMCDCLINLDLDVEGFMENKCSSCRHHNPFSISQTEFTYISKITTPVAPGASEIKKEQK